VRNHKGRISRRKKEHVEEIKKKETAQYLIQSGAFEKGLQKKE